MLEGRKTQTRRVITPQPVEPVMPAISFGPKGLEWALGPSNLMRNGDIRWWRCPYGGVGDRLWVRETFRYDDYASDEVIYQADCDRQAIKDTKGVIRWKPAIHMPRRVSRITLEITGLWVERLHEIGWHDCLAEGIIEVIPGLFGEQKSNIAAPDPRTIYRILWNHIYGKKAGHSWSDNPWVWAIQFRKLHDR